MKVGKIEILRAISWGGGLLVLFPLGKMEIKTIKENSFNHFQILQFFPFDQDPSYRQLMADIFSQTSYLIRIRGETHPYPASCPPFASTPTVHRKSLCSRFLCVRKGGEQTQSS